MNSSMHQWNAAETCFVPEVDMTGVSFLAYFGPNEIIESDIFQTAMSTAFPGACQMGCTAGSLVGDDDIQEGKAYLVAVKLDHSSARTACLPVSFETSAEAGGALAGLLDAPDLAGVLILCDSLNVDGVALVQGLKAGLTRAVPISGGLAADGEQFERTLAGADGVIAERTVAAIGLYGDKLRFSQGSAHGWDDFGPPRRVTYAAGNKLFELDGEPALEIYKRYLGDECSQLPASALRFPLKLWDPDNEKNQVIRTVLGVDEDTQCLIFASSIEEGWNARMMRGAFSNLNAGAAEAARQAFAGGVDDSSGLSLMFSCVGRRLLMGENVIDEIDAVINVLGTRDNVLGFYSHGEISLPAEGGYCGLHNQTMTICTLQEAS